VHVPSTDKEKKQRNSELRGQVSVNWRWKETQEEFAGRPEEEEEDGAPKKAAKKDDDKGGLAGEEAPAGAPA
jgi:hypothetical protein